MPFSLRFRPQFSLRFLLASIVILAMIGGAVAPRLQRMRAIKRLEEKYVYVQVARPDWVPTNMPYGDLFATPVQVLVSIQASSDGHFLLLGERMDLAEADAALQKLRRELRTKFGLNHFILVDDPFNPHEHSQEFMQLSQKYQSTP